MRYKKIVLSIIASVLCLGLLSGCGGYSHDFNSSEEAQKYVLAKLKDKYNEEFTIKEVKKYKEEKIGLNWISVEVSSKENSSQTATVYARNTGLFEDSYHEWTNPPSKKPYFENNINSFRDVLLSIKELAEKIECENFANIFTSAINLLDGCNEYPDEKFGLSLPPIPQQNLQMFEAASVSDVFGAMGSWNDSPAYMAHKKGLSEEYETLSSELLKNVRLAILYAINEW